MGVFSHQHHAREERGRAPTGMAEINDSKDVRSRSVHELEDRVIRLRGAFRAVMLAARGASTVERWAARCPGVGRACVGPVGTGVNSGLPTPTARLRSQLRS